MTTESTSPTENDKASDQPIVTCGFAEAWVGKCKNAKPCEEHADMKCVSCGEPATKTCDSTGQFVCGAPLCDECEHSIYPDGTNGGIGFNAQSCPEITKSHVKATEQKFKPWYTREN